MAAGPGSFDWGDRRRRRLLLLLVAAELLDDVLVHPRREAQRDEVGDLVPAQATDIKHVKKATALIQTSSRCSAIGGMLREAVLRAGAARCCAAAACAAARWRRRARAVLDRELLSAC